LASGFEEHGIAVLVDEVRGDGCGGLVDLAPVNVVRGLVAFVYNDAETFEAQMPAGEFGPSAAVGDGDRSCRGLPRGLPFGRRRQPGRR
jgi:hypothetical protein